MSSFERLEKTLAQEANMEMYLDSMPSSKQFQPVIQKTVDSPIKTEEMTPNKQFGSPYNTS